MGYLLLDALDASQAHEEWKKFFYTDCGQALEALDKFYTDEVEKGKHIFPKPRDIFRAFVVPPKGIRCIILGQDPYHGAGQAMGLSFSVPGGVKCPPSLRNIKKELAEDIPGIDVSGTDLSPWAVQGVFLLNTVLTVEEGLPGSHAEKGWEEITAAALDRIAHFGTGPLVFILWGAYAAKAAAGITAGRPVEVITSAHPSPLSARRGFFGSRPFSRANDFLVKNGVQPIDWSIPER